MGLFTVEQQFSSVHVLWTRRSSTNTSRESCSTKCHDALLRRSTIIMTALATTINIVISTLPSSSSSSYASSSSAAAAAAAANAQQVTSGLIKHGLVRRFVLHLQPFPHPVPASLATPEVVAVRLSTGNERRTVSACLFAMLTDSMATWRRQQHPIYRWCCNYRQPSISAMQPLVWRSRLWQNTAWRRTRVW